MSRLYKLRIQAQCIRQKDKYDPLTQAELQDFFTEKIQEKGTVQAILDRVRPKTFMIVSSEKPEEEKGE